MRRNRGVSAMAFEIYLPQERIAQQRKLWANRLPIDDLDDAVRAAPERTAFVGRNSAQGRRDPAHLRGARRAGRQDRGGARRAWRRQGRRGGVSAAELVGVHGAVLCLQPHRRRGQPADADLPPARAALHDGLCRGQGRRRAGAVARLRPCGHDARDPPRPAASAPRPRRRRHRATSRSSAPSSTAPPHPRRSGGSSPRCGPSPTRWWS